MPRYFNPTTQVIFGSDEAQDAPIRAVTDAEIPDLIAAGATVDASADYTAPNDATGQADASAPGSDAALTAAGTPADAPNGTASAAGDQSKPDETPFAPDAAEPSAPDVDMTDEQRTEQDVVDASNAPKTEPDLSTGQVTPLDADSAATTDELDQPAHGALFKLELMAERAGGDLMIPLKRLIAEVRAEIRKIL